MFSIIGILLLFIISISASQQIHAQDQTNDEGKDKLNENQQNYIGTAIDLDGNESYVEIVNSETINSINQQVTVTAWIKATDFPNRYTPILYKGDQRTAAITNRSFAMHLRSDGSIQFASSPKGKSEKNIFSPFQAISLNKWHHVAGIVDATNNVIKVFVDGEEVGFRDFGRNKHFYQSKLPFRIGQSHEDNVGAQSSFVGQIDQVSVWNVALTEKQIKTYMNKRLTGDEKGLVGYWTFDDVIDGTITDISPNENDARLINTAKIKRYIRPISDDASPETLEKIAKHYEKALANGTDSYEIYSALAEVYEKIGRSADAEKIYLRALKANLNQTEHEDVLGTLWKLYSERNALNEFITVLNELRQDMKDNSVILELLGDAYMQIGQENDAKGYYQEWIDNKINEINFDRNQTEYFEFAKKLLEKDIFIDTALELLIQKGDTTTGGEYINTLTRAFIVNEQFDSAYQIIVGVFNSTSLPFIERRLLNQVIEAGKNVKDQDGYIKMLNKLIDEISDIPRSHLSTSLALAQFYEENNAPEKANTLIRKTGFITEDSWMTLGPFDNTGGIGFDTQYILENLPMIDTTAVYDGKNEKVSWQKCNDDSLYGHIKLGPNLNWCVAYAFATVTSPEERDVQLRFDSDDQGKIWVNGIEVFSHTKTFTAEIDNYIIPVKLSQGKNSILVKVCEEVGGWSFYFRITDIDGQPFDDLIFDSIDED